MQKCVGFILFSYIISSPAHALRVVIDPGHGGTDRGTTRGDITESGITLQVSRELQRELSQSANFKSTLTREDDRYVSLEERAQIANEKADVFISIHVNSSTDANARGKEIYFQNQLDADEETLYLANLENGSSAHKLESAASPSLQNIEKQGVTLNLPTDVKAIVEDLDRNYRLKMSGLLTEELHREWGGDHIRRKQAIRQAPFYVISNVIRPAALIEIGFLTNKIEAEKLVNPAYQRRIAHGIYQALVKFKEVIDNPTAQHLN